MRIRITRAGLYGADGAVPVGTEIDVSEAPKHLDGRYEIVTGSATAKKVAITNPAKGAHPLDHDEDGKPGGSKAAEGDKDALAKLRTDYQEVVGKRPFPGWDADELQRRIDEKLAE